MAPGDTWPKCACTCCNIGSRYSAVVGEFASRVESTSTSLACSCGVLVVTVVLHPTNSGKDGDREGEVAVCGESAWNYR
jgi:hypothetical protein